MSGTWPLLAGAFAPAAAVAPAPDPGGEWKFPRIVGQRCRAEGEEIVVCGRRDPDRYRLKDLGPAATAKTQGGLIGVDLGNGVRAEAEALQTVRPDGLVDKRIMLHFKTKF